jgi:hypothetical protein
MDWNASGRINGLTARASGAGEALMAITTIVVVIAQKCFFCSRTGPKAGA